MTTTANPRRCIAAEHARREVNRWYEDGISTQEGNESVTKKDLRVLRVLRIGFDTCTKGSYKAPYAFSPSKSFVFGWESVLVFGLFGVSMQIRNITLDDIRAGKNWRFTPPEKERWFDAPMETWGPLTETDQFAAEDDVVYSALWVSRSGRVEAIVLIKTVADIDYGGDYCELVEGGWRQLGLVPNPDPEPSEEFIANPLGIDPSFSSDDYREHHRRGFLKYVGKLQ